MRIVLLLLAACLMMGANDPAPDPAAWVQQRLDRILSRTGSAPGEVKIILTDATELPWSHPHGTVQFPRALLLMAPQPEAIDAMLTMLLSYQEEATGDARPRGGLSAHGGGPLDASDERDARRTLGSGHTAATDAPGDPRRAKAWQGARWNGQIGNCTAVQVDFLRAIGKETRLTMHGKPVIWPGSLFGRKVIEYLGAQAYPGGDRRCRTRDDPDFAVIQQNIQGGTGE